MNKHSPKIKICGLIDEQNAALVALSGADFIGIIIHPNSKRHVSLTNAKKIAQAVRLAGAKPVAVMVNQTASEIEFICQQTGINVVQLHGTVARKQHRQLSDHLARIFVIPVDQRGKFNAKLIPDNLRPTRDALLFDNDHVNCDQTINTHTLQNCKHAYNAFIAGKINSINVKNIISTCRPYAIDICSQLESSPGIKSIVRCQQFIREVRHHEH